MFNRRKIAVALTQRLNALRMTLAERVGLFVVS